MTHHQRAEDLTSVAVPGQPALSPDGTRCVYVLRTADTEADRNAHALWHVGEGEPRRLTRGPADTAPAWSPDGSRIVFLRAQDGPPQLWSLPADGGEPEPLTTLPLGASTPVWSPDGTRIAFTAPVDTEGGERTAPVVSDRLDYRADGAGLLRGTRSHLHVLDVATGECRQVTGGDWHAGQPSWSPGSDRIAFCAATAPDADLHLRAPVYTLDVTNRHAVPVLAGLRDGVGQTVCWTADGAALLVAGTEGSPVGHTRLLRVPLGGGPVTDLAGALDRNVMTGHPGYPGAAPRLTGDGRTVLFCVRDRGCTHLYAVPADGGTPRPVVAGAGRNVAGVSVSGTTAAVVLGTPDSYGEVVEVDVASRAETVRTAHSRCLDGVTLFAREEREFTISDGTAVQGWLVRDREAGTPGTPGPLLVDIHGGPHNAWNGAADEIHLYHQELAARGWTILLLNPRGSDGYGESFFTAVSGGWGVADARDFLEPVETLVAEGIADPKRLAVAGYSYGGFMTCYLTSRDNRFAAAVTGGPVTDLVSAAGSSVDGHYLSELELGGTPWAQPARYAQMSPLSKVDSVRTPTLILHGADDLLCPAGQAEQWHTALRERGVPSRLVLYPGASHLFILEGPPSQRVDYNRRIVDWVEQYAGDAAGPRRPRLDAGHWQRRLTELATRHGVPGATLGILRVRDGGEDELVEAAHGVLNVDTGVPTTTDSVFQIGSISKVWTTTVVMQLVDEGLLDLDTPVVEILPELRLSDPDAAKKVTMRHLLTHTSGIDGDVFTDTGRGDDCLEKYVTALADVAQNHPLGATWSYCNSGFSLAGRVLEKLTGQTWDQAMRERIFDRLGLAHTATLPEEVLLHRAAVGHVTDGGKAERAPVWTLHRAAGPAGLICSTVADVLGFARLHLTGGLAPDGTRVLGEASAEAMARFQVEVPDKYLLGDSWGLGWCREEWDSHRLIGHDGNTIGQSAFLLLLPEQGLAVTLLTNGDSARELYEDLFREIFADVAGVAMRTPLEPPAEPVEADLRRHEGTYERESIRMEVLAEGKDGKPALRVTVTGPLAELAPEPTQEYTLTAVAENLFLAKDSDTRMWIPVTFYELTTGERYVHFGARATPRVA